MKKYLSAFTLLFSLLTSTIANAGLIYNFVDETTSETIAIIDLDTNVGQLTHNNILSFNFTDEGNAIFGLGLDDLSDKFYRTSNGSFEDNGSGVLVNPTSSLVFVSTPYGDLGYEGPEPDFITLYFHLKSNGSSIVFSTRDTSNFYARVDGDWVNASTVNEPTSLVLFSLVLGLIAFQKRIRS